MSEKPPNENVLKKINNGIKKKIVDGKEKINKRTEVFSGKLLDFGNMIFGGMFLSQLFLDKEFNFFIASIGFFICVLMYFCVYFYLK